MFPHTVTIYNRVKNREGDTYRRTILEGVFWESENGIKLGDTVIKSDNKFSVVIPMSLKGFVMPKAYQREKDKTDKWTLAEGDFIAKGSHSIDINYSSDLDKLDEVMTISSFEVVDYALMDYLNNYTVFGR